jgi:hypothetical protein
MKKIIIYHSSDEQQKDQMAYLASLTHTQSMNLFFQLMNRVKIFTKNEELATNSKRKIIIHHDNRFWR